MKTSLLGAGALLTGFPGYASREELNQSVKDAVEKARKRKQAFNMCGYAASAVPDVRIGYVGIGSRGSWAVTRILNIEGVQVTALCDLREVAVKNNQQTLSRLGHKPAKEYYGATDSWKKLCEQEDIDLVYIATPWEWHTPVALYAMECGKHVAIEVPAAVTLEECWQLVETSERTRKHCIQLENCCYDFFEILTVNMAQKGLFGEVVHTEAAYIHDLLRGMFGPTPKTPDQNEVWRWSGNLKPGNPYPTHGLGPVCWALNINRGDQMDYLTSMNTNDFMLKPLVEELAKNDNDYKRYTQYTYKGNMNTSLIRTKAGKTILLQHDVTSPRPYDRIHMISGTKGFAHKYPEPARMAFGHEFISPEKMAELEREYTPEMISHIADVARVIGGHGGMDFIMDWRMIDCLRNGLPMDMDVYDAASWSAITALSTWSCENRSNSIEVPDFTGGSWKTNKPVDLTLRGGGNTGVIAPKE